MSVIIIGVGTLVLAAVVVAVVRRRRRSLNRPLNLGVVSQQWLVLHRAEDR